MQWWLFPVQPRVLPHARAIPVALRTVHLATFGLLLGGHAFGVEAARLLPALWLTVLSGAGLIAVEVYAAGAYWLVIGKGVAVLARLGLLLAVPAFWEQRVVLLLTVVAIASVGAHTPACYRHCSLLHRRVIAAGGLLGRTPSSLPGEPVARDPGGGRLLLRQAARGGGGRAAADATRCEAGCRRQGVAPPPQRDTATPAAAGSRARLEA